MDWQQFPAIQGNGGFAFKISIIHLSTRIKYGEIFGSHSTQTLTTFLERAMKRLPTFYIVFTDNHMDFTMKYAYRSECKTSLTKKSRK